MPPLILYPRHETHVAVPSEVLQKLDLAKGALREDLLAKNIGDLLDGDTLVALVVHGGTARERQNASSAPWRGNEGGGDIVGNTHQTIP